MIAQSATKSTAFLIFIGHQQISERDTRAKSVVRGPSEAIFKAIVTEVCLSISYLYVSYLISRCQSCLMRHLLSKRKSS